MTNITNIEIHLDESVKDNCLFQGRNSIEINQTELFKYGIMMWEVPSHVTESDFDYLQNDVPHLEALLARYLEFSINTIFNLSNDDRCKKLTSEVAGVGLGLKYSTELLKTNPNKFKKIGVPDEGKYLDYSTIVDSKEYEIETKGTVSKSYSSMKKDVIEKKKDSSLKKVHLRFGTITLLKNKGDKSESKCVIVDDPPENEMAENDDTFETQLLSYAIFLSYILDSTYYNKYIKPLQKRKFRRIRINNEKFFGKYEFQNRFYFGECFDYRLIRENFESLRGDYVDNESFFRKLTEKVGVTKFFIGLDEKVVDAINKKDIASLSEYESESVFIEEGGTTSFLDKDGILIVKTTNRSDSQIEEIFPDSEVEKRLGLYENYLRRNAHQCKAPCRSKDKEGKPCEIMTFRENCHFHR